MATIYSEKGARLVLAAYADSLAAGDVAGAESVLSTKLADCLQVDSVPGGVPELLARLRHAFADVATATAARDAAPMTPDDQATAGEALLAAETRVSQLTEYAVLLLFGQCPTPQFYGMLP